MNTSIKHVLHIDDAFYVRTKKNKSWYTYTKIDPTFKRSGPSLITDSTLVLKFKNFVPRGPVSRPMAFSLKDHPEITYEFTMQHSYHDISGYVYHTKKVTNITPVDTQTLTTPLPTKPTLSYNYFTTLSLSLNAFLSLFDSLSFAHLAHQESHDSVDRLPHWVFELDWYSFEVPISNFDVDYTIPDIEKIFPYTSFVDLINHVPVLTIPLRIFNFFKDSTKTTADRFGYPRKRLHSSLGFIHVSILESMSKWLWLVKFILFYFAGPLLYYVLVFTSFSKFFSKLHKLVFIDDRNFFGVWVSVVVYIFLFYSSQLFVFIFVLRSSERV